MNRNFQSVAIVGSGAIGLYYGGRLAAAGGDVRFLVRSDHEEISRHGLHVESIHGDFSLPRVSAFRTPEEIGPVDLVIVAWKATANSHFARVLPPLLHSGTRILTLQNGLGNCEEIAEIAGPDRIFGGLCFVCINCTAPARIVHSGGGRIDIGGWRSAASGRAEEIVRHFQNAGILAFTTVNLEKSQWEKLVWNIPFNGLAIAEGGVTTDVLLANPAVVEEIRALMAEILATARRLGLDLEESLIESNIARTRPMGAYRPSSMIDFLAGREVEVGSIWERPIARAAAAGLGMPRTRRLLGRIRGRIDRG